MQGKRRQTGRKGRRSREKEKNREDKGAGERSNVTISVFGVLPSDMRFVPREGGFLPSAFAGTRQNDG